jgi:trehalose-phosphatase
MDRMGFVARATAAPSLLVATDFDGTLAEITVVPDEAHAAPGALEALAVLARCPCVHVAVVSGRTLDDLTAKTAGLGAVWRVAEHGAFIESPAGVAAAFERPREVVSDERMVIDELARIAAEIAPQFEGMRVERKSASVAVHVREVPVEQRPPALQAMRPFRDAALESGLCLMDGRNVIEARGRGCSKERALETILAALPKETMVIYAGDDTTDEGSIALAHERGGLGVYVASTERPSSRVEADVVLSGPKEWVEVLRMLADRRSAAKVAGG